MAHGLKVVSRLIAAFFLGGCVTPVMMATVALRVVYILLPSVFTARRMLASGLEPADDRVVCSRGACIDTRYSYHSYDSSQHETHAMKQDN